MSSDNHIENIMPDSITTETANAEASSSVEVTETVVEAKVAEQTPTELPENTPTWVKAAVNESGPNSYLVDLDSFQGPMELLLYLIKKDELDLHDIPVAKITEQYLRYVEVIHELNLEAAGDFILMAATLIRIKTRMLLPRDETDSDELDPREELVMALLEYKRFKEASESLRELREGEEDVFVPERKQLRFSDGPGVPSNSVFQLIEAFKAVMQRVDVDSTHVTGQEPVSIAERVEQIITLLKEQESATFVELFADAQTKIVAIVTLIALLEMSKARRLTFQQVNSFAEVRVYRGEAFYDEGEIIVDEWEGAHDESPDNKAEDKVVDKVDDKVEGEVEKIVDDNPANNETVETTQVSQAPTE